MNPRYCRALLTSWKIFAALAQAHTRQLGESWLPKERGLRFSIVLPRDKAPSPLASAEDSSTNGAGLPKFKAMRGPTPAPPPLFRCGEMKVWELLLFVPGICAGAATWAEGRLGDAVAQVSSLVGNKNDKWLPLGTPPAFLQDRLSRQRVICIPTGWEPASLSTALRCAPLRSPPPLLTPAQLWTRLPAPRPT